MRFEHATTDYRKLEIDTLVIAFESIETLRSQLETLDSRQSNIIQRMLQDNEISTKKTKSHLFHCSGDTLKRLIIISTGEITDAYSLSKFSTELASSLHLAQGLCTAVMLPVRLTKHTELLSIGRAIHQKYYRFDQHRCSTEKQRQATLHILSDNSEISRQIKDLNALNVGIALCQSLGNTPPNICTPSYLANQAAEMAERFASISEKTLNEADLVALKMGCLLAVNQGSAQPPKLITMHYQGGSESTPTIGLVGKGVTFDSGGINIKPSAGMELMTYDMLGAATVFGVFQAAALAQLKINLVAVIPCVENMPDGRASRPGDVVTSMSGKTVEILNTDAEGRLILCDALTYTQRNFKTKAIIDIATLTGAAIVALGHQHTALFSNDEELASGLRAAGKTANDTFWQMPLDQQYNDLLRSKIADIGNIGGKSAGAITAACFLQRFINKNQAWAHLDIAGTASGGTQELATGRPVSALFQYLADLQA